MPIRIACWSCLASLAAASMAAGQTLTVQQPVVDVFNVNTVVSVPDRGSTLLGGVSRAAEGQFQNGFAPYGSSIGLERSNTSVRASVYIHDFEAMDAALLATPVAGREPKPQFTNPLAANAYRSLLRQGARGASTAPRLANRGPGGSSATTVAPSATPLPLKPVSAPVAQSSGEPSSAAVADSNLSTNSGVSPAASRAAR